MLYISLDTSQINNIITDLYSKKSKSHGSTKELIRLLINLDIAFVITWHHFEELIRHKNLDLVNKRLDFINRLPFIAMVKSFNGNSLTGSIVDLQALELSKICQYSELEPTFIKNKVTYDIFHVVSGEQFLHPYLNQINEIRFHLWQKEHHDQEIVAISRSRAIPSFDGTISELLEITELSSSEQALKLIASQAIALAKDITIRGDKRISDPQKTAINFYQSIIDFRQSISAKSAKELIIEIFNLQEIDLQKMPQNLKISQVLELAEVRCKIKTVTSTYPVAHIDKFIEFITPQTIPSMSINYGLKKYGQDQKERKGSELNDRYISGFAPYVDLFYADKRTANDFIQMQRKEPEISNLVKCFKKTCALLEIIKDVQQLLTNRCT